MEEKYYLQNILTLSKSLISLYINAEVESTNIEIKKKMHKLLEKSLELQYDLFKEMENNGYYNLKNIDSTTIKKTYTQIKMT